MMQSGIGLGVPLEYGGRTLVPVVTRVQSTHQNGGVVSRIPIALLILEYDQVWFAPLQEGISVQDILRILAGEVDVAPGVDHVMGSPFTGAP